MVSCFLHLNWLCALMMQSWLILEKTHYSWQETWAWLRETKFEKKLLLWHPRHYLFMHFLFLYLLFELFLFLFSFFHISTIFFCFQHDIRTHKCHLKVAGRKKSWIITDKTKTKTFFNFYTSCNIEKLSFLPLYLKYKALYSSYLVSFRNFVYWVKYWYINRIMELILTQKEKHILTSISNTIIFFNALEIKYKNVNLKIQNMI